MTRHRILFAVALLLPLGGCMGALLGGGKPDTLYRLEEPRAEDGDTLRPAVAGQQTVALLPLSFAPQIAGDRILTSAGAEALYLKGALGDGRSLHAQASRGRFITGLSG